MTGKKQERKLTIKKRKKYCEFLDCGWCYRHNSKYTNGCVGINKCNYFKN
jgi:hypothetical protein